MAGVNHLVGGKYTAVTHRRPGKVRANRLSQQLHPPKAFSLFLGIFRNQNDDDGWWLSHTLSCLSHFPVNWGVDSSVKVLISLLSEGCSSWSVDLPIIM